MRVRGCGWELWELWKLWQPLRSHVIAEVNGWHNWVIVLFLLVVMSFEILERAALDGMGLGDSEPLHAQCANSRELPFQSCDTCRRRSDVATPNSNSQSSRLRLEKTKASAVTMRPNRNRGPRFVQFGRCEIGCQLRRSGLSG